MLNRNPKKGGRDKIVIGEFFDVLVDLRTVVAWEILVQVKLASDLANDILQFTRISSAAT